ncbi:alpha-L-fucosidase [Jiangella asiatica]|uniref:alpha-L-fucosidase n=1 Tax=Jiangella asiatica TaxID=2530372 RepID=A0A4R5DJY0_9ACTN|nr:alpha-L-fucosidase [Jiangella asiatica]TDE11145.1 hypothetical protein E1269_09735 [Jiangella asiatica]
MARQRSPRTRWRLGLAAVLAAAALPPAAAADPGGDSPGAAYVSMGYGVFMHYGLATFVGRTPWDYDPQDVPPTVYDPPDFDPDQWMDAIAASGATYVLLTTKHHDGFVMWPSEYTDYGVHHSSDPETDVVGEVVDAARDHGLKVALYYSWLDKMEPGGFVTQNPDRITESPEYLAYAKNQITELLTGYGPIEALWLDIAPIDDEQLPELADHVHTVSPDTAFLPNFPNNLATPEAADVRPFLGPDEIVPCGYQEPAEQAYNVSGGPEWWQASDRPPRADTDEVVSMVSYTRFLGATLSLNVSPGPTGQLPSASVRLLEAIGDRLRGDDILADAATTASGETDAHPASHATDLLAQTHWQAPATGDAWLQVDLAEPMTIDHTAVQFTAGTAVSGYEIQYQDADGSWRTAWTGGMPSYPTQTDEFRAVTTASLRLVLEGAADDAGVVEFKAYGGVDDTADTVRYDGSWQALARPAHLQAVPRLPPSVPFAGAFNDSIHRSRYAGDVATIAFSGTGVQVHASTGPDQGTALVSVDGGEPELVDLYRPEAGRDQIVYRRDVLDPGQHTLTVEVTGQHHDEATDSWVGLDRFVPLAVPAPFDPGGPYEVLPDGRLVFDDSGNRCSNDSAITYTGSWEPGGASDGYNGTRHVSRTAGSAAELTFEGTGVAVLAQTRPGHGIAAISVDGGEPHLVDTYSPTRQDQVVVWETTGLAPGAHTVRIEVTGTKNPAATNTWIGLDAFIVTPEPAL